MRAPADNELGDAGVLEHLILGQESLFGVVIAGAGAGIELGNLCVGNRRGQTKQQSAEDAQPHGWRGGSGGGLDVEGEPEKRSGGDERHSVAGQPCEA